VSGIEAKEDKTFQITREVDGGLQVLRYQAPFIITTDLRLNEPRYASLQMIMKAKKMPIRKESLETLQLDLKAIMPRLTILQLQEPAKRLAGKKVDSVDALIKALKEEAQIL
jgi:electron transfer flavoprotein beta subunit